MDNIHRFIVQSVQTDNIFVSKYYFPLSSKMTADESLFSAPSQNIPRRQHSNTEAETGAGLHLSLCISLNGISTQPVNGIGTSMRSDRLCRQTVPKPAAVTPDPRGLSCSGGVAETIINGGWTLPVGSCSLLNDPSVSITRSKQEHKTTKICSTGGIHDKLII